MLNILEFSHDNITTPLQGLNSIGLPLWMITVKFAVMQASLPRLVYIQNILTKFMNLMYKQNVNGFLCNKTFLPHKPQDLVVTWWISFLSRKPSQEGKSQWKFAWWMWNCKTAWDKLNI